MKLRNEIFHIAEITKNKKIMDERSRLILIKICFMVLKLNISSPEFIRHTSTRTTDDLSRNVFICVNPIYKIIYKIIFSQ